METAPDPGQVILDEIAALLTARDRTIGELIALKQELTDLRRGQSE